MPKNDAIEIQATMKSLAMLLDLVVRGNQALTANYMMWFLIKLDDLLQFASKKTARKLQRIIAQIEHVQEQLHDEEPPDEIPPELQEALRLMREVLQSK